MSDADAALSLNRLCEWLHRYYGKKTIILMDEYDTPLQEAWIQGYWNELVSFTRAMFNNTYSFVKHFNLHSCISIGNPSGSWKKVIGLFV